MTYIDSGWQVAWTGDFVQLQSLWWIPNSSDLDTNIHLELTIWHWLDEVLGDGIRIIHKLSYTRVVYSCRISGVGGADAHAILTPIEIIVLPATSRPTR